jgi:hypothetical protein
VDLDHFTRFNHYVATLSFLPKTVSIHEFAIE